MAKKKLVLSYDEVISLIDKMYHKQEKFKKHKEHFEEFKSDFNLLMEDYFQGTHSRTNESFLNSELETDEYITRRTQRQNIIFDADKVEKALKKVDKDFVDLAITKTYEINDMQGLVNYLKECGVDPKIFKSFVNVQKKVNNDALDNLFNVGKISIDTVSGCYEIDRKKPFYTVKRKA